MRYLICLLLTGCTMTEDTEDKRTDIIWCVGACIHANQHENEKQTEIEVDDEQE